MEIFISAIGLIMIFEGLPYFVNPNGMKGMAAYLMTVETKKLRVGGLVMMTCGLAILYVFHSS